MNTIIEKLHQEWCSLQPINEALQRKMDTSFMIDFNYNSNHIEGNTLTYGQTKLLLLFGKVKGEALMKDFEEMKAHNTGLEIMKVQALDRERPLSESFIRNLNRIILVDDYYQVSRDGEYRYKIHVGVYKTRPNSVITFSGAMFDYASPEETPSMMADLVRWYNDEEQKGELSVTELAALFHYRYIRIHPFEDGNGRIARLIMNYIFYRHGYPMIVIPSADRKKYISALSECDEATGKETFRGANATLKEVKPFVNLISTYTERKLKYAIQLAKGEISEISETDIEQQKDPVDSENVSVSVSANVSVKENILNIVGQFPMITVKELSKMLSVTERTIYRNIGNLKAAGKINRVGSDKTGYWKIN